MSIQDDINWFKQQFQQDIQAAIGNTPFSIELITAIALQETGYLWRNIYKKQTVAKTLELCVGDTISAPNRTAFPKDKDHLLSKPRGDEMFAIAREALESIAPYNNDFSKAAKKPDKFCHGFGIFQYDIQFFLDNPNFFLEKRWYEFDECLKVCIDELNKKLVRTYGSDKSSLTDREMVYVAIAYNRGRADLDLDFKQGYKDSSGKYYGEYIWEYLQLAKSKNIMTTLQQIISNSSSLTRDHIKADRALVMEIQTVLANLGFYPGGGWIDGNLGGLTSFSWKGLIDFCTRVGSVSIPSEDVAINPDIAQKLLDTKQIESILSDAADTISILNKLKEIQPKSPIVNPNTQHSAFVARTIDKSPFQKFINDYPTHLEQKPDGTSIISYGDNFTLSTGATISFSDYPNLGKVPNIDTSGLDFLSSNISHACVCVGSFQDSTSFIKTHWLGKKALEPQQFLSTTKFIGVLNAICQINSQSLTTDVDDYIIESPRYRFNSLVEDMVSYRNKFGSSNAIGALFKRFTKREDLESWIKDQTGNKSIEFCGAYGEDPLITNPNIQDTTTGKPVLKSTSRGKTGDNSISAYDLVRLISMLGWHQHLPVTAQLSSAQWTSLESVLRAMGRDTARYVDVALETLGIVNVISEPVIISKVGWGDSSMTYAALVKFVDRRITPSKLRTFALALRCPTPASSDDRDTNLAAAVTEIVRRIITEELA